MAFASGSVSYRRYRVTGSRFRSIDDTLLDALNGNAFGRYGTATADDTEVGWITPAHLFDVDFSGDKIAAGRFAHFRMRLDRNSVPGSILRSYIQIEEQAAIEAADRDYINKEERRQAKDAAKRRAEKEARSGAFRRIIAYPVLLDLENDVLYFGNTSNTANDKLGPLFADTFDAKLEPINTHELAVRAAAAGKLERALEDMKPAHLVASPEGVNADIYTMDAADRGFVGREFLSWLLYCVDQCEGTFDLGGAVELTACAHKVVHMKCDFNMTGSDIIRCDDPIRAAETRAALATGKQPAKVALLVGSSVGEWSLTLDSLTMDVTGMTLPAAEDDDPKARIEGRFENIAEAAGLMDVLFEKFCRLRLSTQWQKQLGAMKGWAAAGRVDPHLAQSRKVSA